VVLEKILISKITFDSKSCGSNETSKSTSIFPHSLCFSLLYELDSNVKPNLDVDPYWVCALLSSKSNITRCGIMCW
jgi:hypothetical protein